MNLHERTFPWNLSISPPSRSSRRFRFEGVLSAKSLYRTPDICFENRQHLEMEDMAASAIFGERGGSMKGSTFFEQQTVESLNGRAVSA